MTLKSSVTGKTYSIKATANCRTANVVYNMIECTKCSKQYVGETENVLHIWMNDHRVVVKHWHLEKPVGSHFNSEGHSLEDLSILWSNSSTGRRQTSESKREPLDLNSRIAHPKGTYPQSIGHRIGVMMAQLAQFSLSKASHLPLLCGPCAQQKVG